MTSRWRQYYYVLVTLFCSNMLQTHYYPCSTPGEAYSSPPCGGGKAKTTSPPLLQSPSLTWSPLPQELWWPWWIWPPCWWWWRQIVVLKHFCDYYYYYYYYYVIAFMQGIYNYIPKTSHVSSLQLYCSYNLWYKQMLFFMLNIL